MKHTLLITGAAGYVGAMLCEQFSKRDDVERIIGLDMEPMPDLLKGNAKIAWIQANTSDGTWQEKASAFSPDIVVHAAWQIRAIYGNFKKTWKWNVDGSKAVFEFALNNKNVRRLVHFSTAAIYGAFPENTFEHLFKESEPMREKEYIYAVEKQKSEEDLDAAIASSKSDAMVAVVRPAAITGPRGRYMRIRFGLQSALSGQLKGGVYGLISALVSLVPATKGWVRQFVHEDDVVDIVGKLAFEPWKGGKKEIYNLAPGGAPVYAADMARAVGKGLLPVSPLLVRVAYFFFWHLTRGKVPTAPGSWRFYSYPIVMDGSKIETMLGHRYFAPSYEAFKSTKGRYEAYVPEESRTKS
jgi:nucleoside-diphosphate-sugar epimerase